MKFPLSKTMSSRDLMPRMIEYIIKIFFSVLGIKPRALHMYAKSVPELYSGPKS